MGLPTREAGTPRGVSDGSSYKSSSQGLHAPLVADLCRAAQGVALQILSKPGLGLHTPCNWELSPASNPQHSEGNCHYSLHGRAGVRPLWPAGGRGTRDKVQAQILARPTQTPGPGQSTSTPGPRRATRLRSRRAHERAAHNFSLLIAASMRLRGARRPSPSKARCLTVPTAGPRRP